MDFVVRLFCQLFFFHSQEFKLSHTHTHTPAQRRCWSPGHWALPSSLGDSCCYRCWPGGRDEGGVLSASGRSPASGGRTLETPQRELGEEGRNELHIKVRISDLFAFSVLFYASSSSTYPVSLLLQFQHAVVFYILFECTEAENGHVCNYVLNTVISRS